jgi:hypothetical protein
VVEYPRNGLAFFWEVCVRAGTFAALASSLLVAFAPLQAAAQGFSDEPVGFSRIVSVNPVLLVVRGSLAADIEQRVGPSVTLGASFANFNFSKADYLTLEGRARYYVSGRALDGIAVGTVLGFVRLSEDADDGENSVGMNLGFTGERQWLLGAEERVAVTVGAGATRIFFAEDRPAFRSVLPILRLSVGWGF